MNSFNVSGFVGKDAEMRTTPSGKVVSSFSLAEKSFGKTNWFDVVCWGNTAEFAARNVKKGSFVMVSSRVTVNEWEGKDGMKKSKFEIVANSVEFAPRQEKKEDEEEY